MSVARPVIAVSPVMTAVLAQVARAGQTDETVLLLGESGTGKELLARAIHAGSPRAAKPFVAVNCGALPDEMVEAILFGYEKGAFTGAVARRDGKFVEADTGTLFLDEIGELTPALQVKLLRALQEREVDPLGGRPRKIDVRVVAATNRDLIAMMRRGQFREDFYYRLDVLTIRSPPLRERPQDIPALVQHFLSTGARPPLIIDGEAMDRMKVAPWPGNVRQLENFVKKLVLAASGPTIGLTETARLLAEAEPGEGAPAAAPLTATQPGSETRPAATASGKVVGGGLAMAWWRFHPLPDAAQLYTTDLGALESTAKIEHIPFVDGRARIGRERGQVEVALETGEVSRIHATIAAQAGGFTITDEDSRNRTYVDARVLDRGERAPLKTGTVVRIGKEWLGIAIALGPSGLPTGAPSAMTLARAFNAAGGNRQTRLDIRALEALCAGRADDAAVLQAAGAALASDGVGVVDRERALAALPVANVADWRSMTRAQLLALVEACNGNKREAARRLGISPQTLYTRLKTDG